MGYDFKIYLDVLGGGDFGWRDGTLELGLGLGRVFEGWVPRPPTSPPAPPLLWLLSPWDVCPLPSFMPSLLCSFCPMDLSSNPAASC